MVKGFSESEFKKEKPIKDLEKEKKGLASFLKGKKFTYTLPGKKPVSYTHLTLPTILLV